MFTARGWVAALAAASAVACVAMPARAEQFVLLDVTFTYTKMDADTSSPDKSHYYVRSDRLNPARPRDWTSPIDYRHGVVHVRTDVIDKPAGGENVRWTLCYIPYRGIGGGYGCTNSAAYQEEGVFDFEQSMTEWWQNDAIDWTQGIQEVDLVMKDGSGPTGFVNLRPDFEKFFPTTLRMTMIQVSAGSTYDPTLVPNVLTDAGADARADAAGTADAGAHDATGSSGAAGAGGGAIGSSGTSGAGGVMGGSGATGGAAGASGVAGGSGTGMLATTSGGGGRASDRVTEEGSCSISRRAPNGSGFAFLVATSSLVAARRRRARTKIEG
jgi:hypothetical protein